MRVAFIHPDLGLGGAERLVVDAALCLRAAGHRVAIFTAHHDRQRCFEETRDGALDLRVHGAFLPAHVGQRLQAPCAIARMSYLAGVLALRSGDFDVIICDLVAHAVPVLRLLTRAPIVFYCHFPDLLLTRPRRNFPYRVYRLPIDWLEEVGFRMADRVVVNSQFSARRLREAFPRRRFNPAVLYPGVDVARYACVANDGTAEGQRQATILVVARYARAKNVGLAIEALAALRRQVPAAAFDRVRLVVAGGYNERLQECKDTLLGLQTQARAFGLAERVDFLCSVTDAERLRLLERCNCVVHTTENEHFGFVPLEAMASGRPVIAVDSGGTRETVRHGETGLLCAPNAEAFADALAALITNPHRACRMGQAGRTHVAEHFSHRAFGARLEVILRDVIGGRTAEADQC